MRCIIKFSTGNKKATVITVSMSVEEDILQERDITPTLVGDIFIVNMVIKNIYMRYSQRNSFLFHHV